MRRRHDQIKMILFWDKIICNICVRFSVFKNFRIKTTLLVIALSIINIILFFPPSSSFSKC